LKPLLDHPSRQWILRALRFAAALALLAWAVEFTSAFLDPFSQAVLRDAPGYLRARIDLRGSASLSAPENWRRFLQGQSDKLAQPILNEVLTIQAPPEKQPPGALEADLTLTLPKDHSLIRALRAVSPYAPQYSLSGLMDTAILGIEVDRRQLSFSRPEIDISENDPNAHVTLRAFYRAPYRSAGFRIAPATLQPAVPVTSRELVVNTNGATVDSDLEPITESPDRTRFAFPEHFDFPVFVTVDFDSEPAATPPSLPPARWVAALRDIATRLGYGFVDVLPPLLLLLVLRRHRAEFGAAAEPIAALSLLAIGFDLTSVVLSAAEYMAGANGGLADLAQWLLAKTGAWPRDYQVLHNGANYAMLGMAAIAWPLVMRRIASDKLPRRRGRLLRAIVFLAAFAFAAAWVWISFQVWTSLLGEPPTTIEAWALQLALALLSFPVVFAAAWWVLRELRQNTARSWYAFLLAALLLGITAALGTSSEMTVYKAVSAAAVLLCGAAFLLAYAQMAARIFLHRALAPHMLSARWLAMFVLCMVAVPVLVSSNVYDPQWYETWNLVNDAVAFTLILVLLRVVFWFKEAAQASGWPECLSAARETGIVLALIFFFSGGNWQSVTLQLVTGYLLVRFLLLQTAQVPAGFKDRPDARAVAIAAVIRLNDMARVTKTLKRELLGKLGKGEITYQTYRSRLDPVELEEAEARRELEAAETPSRDFVLAFGPTDSAWENGLNMAAYGLAFALPWIVLSLRNLAPKGQWYGLLPVLDSALNIVARWALYGFFMGYFYAYLKGRTGIQKGFWFTFTMVTPAAIATGVFQSATPHAWQGFSFWAIQVLITSMLLGLLAGDLETLHRAGYRWRDVLEVHNLGALSAWASALVLALGTTLTSILATGLGTLVTAALQYTGVLPAKIPPHP